jgi:eukaryotic-like serine/threonine-protein kinase
MSHSHPDDEAALAELVGKIADEFTQELDQGDKPSIESYARRYPQLAVELRQILPALQLMRVTDGDPTPTGPVVGASKIAPDGRLGDYHLIREIGRGGMGVVFEAEQISLGRRVALKVLPTVAAVDAKHLQRFKNEAHAAAQLHHSHIVPVYGIGCERDWHFYVMQVIDGRTLAELIHSWQSDKAKKNGDTATLCDRAGDGVKLDTPVTDHQAAEWGVQAADALEHAHQVGILHRDIKPANLLIDRQSQLWITDFGLARLTGEAELTMTGDLLGTVRYMSPEQALARHALVDQRTDVYSLGVTLYEVLTLEPAFSGSDRAALLHQVAFEEPRPPRRLRRSIPIDLETIVLKAIAKNREERYQSAQELSLDLRRFLNNHPIQARRPSAWQHTKKWAQRHKAVVVTAAASAVAALLALTTLATWGRFQLQEKQHETEQALVSANTRRLEADKANRDLQRTLIDTFTATGVTAGDRGDADQAVLWFAHAAQMAESGAASSRSDARVDSKQSDTAPLGDPERARANRQRVRFWSKLIPAPVAAAALQAEVDAMSFRPGGEQLLVVSRKGHCVMLDPRTHAADVLGKPGQAITAAAWSADGARYALGDARGEVEIFDFPGRKLAQHFHQSGVIRCLTFSADSRLLAVGGNKVRLWDCCQAEFTMPVLNHPQQVRHLVFNARGDKLVTACADGLTRIFAVAPGAGSAEPVLPPLGNLGSRIAPNIPLKPLFVDHDRGLIVRGLEGAVWLDAQSGKELRQIAKGEIQEVAASADGRFLVVCFNFQAQIWSVEPPRPLGQPLPHIYSVVANFSPDGQILLTGSSRAVRRWSVPSASELPMPLQHQEALKEVVCSSSGQFFASAQFDGLVRIWTYPGASTDERRIPVEAGGTFVRPSPDGRLFLPPGIGWWPNNLRRTRVYALDSGEPAGPYLGAAGLITDAALSPDGQSAVTIAATADVLSKRFMPAAADGRGGVLQRWNWRTGQALGDPLILPADPRNVAYSPDGRRLVALCGGGQALLIDSSNGAVLKRLEHGGAPSSENAYSAVQFSPDGKTFVTCGLIAPVRLWDTATGTSAAPVLEHKDHCRSAAFSANGKYLVTASRDKLARVWNVASGQLAAPALEHPMELFGASFNPDGRLIVTACGDGMARVWDWESGKLAGPALKQGDGVCAAVFSPDGRTVFVVDRSGNGRLWEFHTGKPLTPLLAVGAKDWFPMTAFWSADGTRALAACLKSPVPVLDFHDLYDRDNLEGADLVRLTEVLSGHRVEEGGITGLSSSEWLERWSSLRLHHPDLKALTPVAEADWHSRQAQASENVHDSATAAWHFGRLVNRFPDNPAWHVRLGIVSMGGGAGRVDSSSPPGSWERGISRNAWQCLLEWRGFRGCGRRI